MKKFLNTHQKILKSISSEMLKRKLTLSVAESCTGGFLSHCFTSVSGSSQYFKGSMVVYSNESKIQLLNITKKDIDRFGVASEQVVQLMAKNIREKYNTHVGLATTGYVDIFNNSTDLYAWIAISSQKSVKSKCLFLEKSRLENIEIISSCLLRLLIKEII